MQVHARTCEQLYRQHGHITNGNIAMQGMIDSGWLFCNILAEQKISTSAMMMKTESNNAYIVHGCQQVKIILNNIIKLESSATVVSTNSFLLILNFNLCCSEIMHIHKTTTPFPFLVVSK